MRVGYFGGTFDPPHRGHLRIAIAAADSFQLDRVVLAPTGIQPLKTEPAQATYADRLAMVRLLCAEDSRLQASDVDAPNPDESPNYTVDALERIRSMQPNAALFAVVGADSFLSLSRWKHPELLLQMAEWIVVSRPEIPLEEASFPEISEAQRQRVHLLTTMHEEVSSTGIRERLQVGVSCGDMLTPAVALYIARMHLYHAD